MFRLYCPEDSLTVSSTPASIARYLNSKGFVWRWGQKFQALTVCRVLADRTYVGGDVFLRRRLLSVERVVVAAPAIVDRYTFERAQCLGAE
ncbi:recombinase family protein [Rhizobium gallicum]|uniref:recombinase family protein n=1 Tax=Rhizobium gallicum TaxID=56730 RepID=UPI00093A35F4